MTIASQMGMSEASFVASYQTMWSPNVKIPDSVGQAPPVPTNAGGTALTEVTLQGVATYNGLRWAQQHSNWDLYAARFGEAASAIAQAEQDARIARFGASVLSGAAVAGIPVSFSSNSSTASVSGSDFVTNGATFAVKTAADGGMTATKDGTAWKAFPAPQQGAATLTAAFGGKTPGAIAAELLANMQKVLSLEV